LAKLARWGVLFSVLLLPAHAAATCVGQPTPRWAAHQALALLLNPMGAEHNLAFGLCLPLYGDADPVFSENHLEFGATTYLSPVYLVGGGYAELAPASFFFARAELNGMGMWTLPLDGAGYFPRAGYGERWTMDDLPAATGGTASGWTFRGMGVLRGRVDLAPMGSGSVGLLVLDAYFVDYTELGDASYYAALRFDVIAARRDWVATNEAMLMVGIPIEGGPEVRLGAFDQTRNVWADGYVGNQVGGIVMLTWMRPSPGIEELDVFIRVGAYTNHGVRLYEPTTLGCVSLDQDLGGL
jgi:hypothetical protein